MLIDLEDALRRRIEALSTREKSWHGPRLVSQGGGIPESAEDYDTNNILRQYLFVAKAWIEANREAGSSEDLKKLAQLEAVQIRINQLYRSLMDTYYPSSR